MDYTVKNDDKKTKLNYRAVDYLQILIIKYEELLQDTGSIFKLYFLMHPSIQEPGKILE